MRIILVSFLAAFLLVSCGKEKPVIKSQIIKKCWSVDGQIDSSKLVISKESLNSEDGLLIDWKSYNSDGTLAYYSTFTYKMHNDTLASEIVEFNQMKDKETIARLFYNDEDKLVKSKRWVKPDSSNAIVIIYRYDTEGRLIEENRDNGNDVWTYKYDKNGNKIEAKSNEKDSRTYIVKYIYDKNNLLVYNTSLYQSDSYVSYDSTVSIYDKDRRIIEDNLFNQFKEIVSKTEYKYDENNNVISTLTTNYPYKEKTYEYTSFYNNEPVYETKEPEYKKVLTIYEYKYY